MGTNGIYVIDADGHIRERDEDLRPYLPEPYRSRDRQFYPNDNWDRSFGGKLGRMVFDLPTRLKDMDLEGIDLAVLYPTSGLSIGAVRSRSSPQLCAPPTTAGSRSSASSRPGSRGWRSSPSTTWRRR